MPCATNVVQQWHTQACVEREGAMTHCKLDHNNCLTTDIQHALIKAPPVPRAQPTLCLPQFPCMGVSAHAGKVEIALMLWGTGAPSQTHTRAHTSARRGEKGRQHWQQSSREHKHLERDGGQQHSPGKRLHAPTTHPSPQLHLKLHTLLNKQANVCSNTWLAYARACEVIIRLHSS